MMKFNIENFSMVIFLFLFFAYEKTLRLPSAYFCAVDPGANTGSGYTQKHRIRRSVSKPRITHHNAPVFISHRCALA